MVLYDPPKREEQAKESKPLAFPDVRETPQITPWAETGTFPDWLTCVVAGLSIRGDCESPHCVAFGKRVVCAHPRAFVGRKTYQWRLGDAAIETRCPMCHAHVTPKNVGFNNCFFRVCARVHLSNPNSPQALPQSSVMHSGKWQEAGDAYVSWESGTRNSRPLLEWDELEFYVRENPHSKRNRTG